MGRWVGIFPENVNLESLKLPWSNRRTHPHGNRLSGARLPPLEVAVVQPKRWPSMAQQALAPEALYDYVLTSMEKATGSSPSST